MTTSLCGLGPSNLAYPESLPVREAGEYVVVHDEHPVVVEHFLQRHALQERLQHIFCDAQSEKKHQSRSNMLYFPGREEIGLDF